VNTEGLFQWGHSKDHRPDLAQVKIMLSTLDPLARISHKELKKRGQNLRKCICRKHFSSYKV